MSNSSHQELKSVSHKQLKAEILAELRKQTTLLEVLAKQGDHAALRTAPATGAAASGLPG